MKYVKKSGHGEEWVKENVNSPMDEHSVFTVYSTGVTMAKTTVFL
jgi:hypothetical protein